MFQSDDTIAAISTAAGSAGRAIVRVSGPEAFQLAGRLFSPVDGKLDQLAGFRAAGGIVRIARSALELPARAYAFRAPRSYTRQDVLELHVPGPAAVATAVLSALIAEGARQAGPGEFTARAFFSGRVDLSEAEAVADVIDAADDAQLRAAAACLGGRVFDLCKRAAAQLTECLASVEASIDLAAEDITVDSPAHLAGLLGDLSAWLRDVAERAAAVADRAAHPHAVLAGRPNVGKSSLLNALGGTDRAIISALAGTTRDVLTVAVTLEDGSSFVLQDAAGFGPADSSLAAAADAAARLAVRAADVVLFVVEATAEKIEPDMELLALVRSTNRRAPVVVLASKLDLLDEPARASRPAELAGLVGGPVLGTSVVTGAGLAELRAKLAEMLALSAGRAGEALGLHERQKQSLLDGAAAAGRASELLDAAADVADVAELAAVELRESLAQLGAISGEVVTEDVLGRIFARFCVGK